MLFIYGYINIVYSNVSRSVQSACAESLRFEIDSWTVHTLSPKPLKSHLIPSGTDFHWSNPDSASLY